MVNTPIPHSLKSEANKAAKILREFSIPNAKTGPDKLIPAGILAKARGLAILTVFKAGFLVTARGGSGIVIAKLDDSLNYGTGWSAPSAIALAGLGGGFEIGMEVTDFVIILNSRSAVDAFSKGGNLTLGGNFTIAAGPLGRNLEGDIAVRSPAAIYTYSKTKGIFAGISVEGSALIERKDANKKFYGRELRAYQILNGEVDPPESCHALYRVLQEHQAMAAKAMLQVAKSYGTTARDYATDMAVAHSSGRQGSDFAHSSRQRGPSTDWGSKSTKSKSSSTSSARKMSGSNSDWTLSTASSSSSSSRPVKSSLSSSSLGSSRRSGGHQGSLPGPGEVDEGEGLWVVVDFSFPGELSCDLPLQAGERVRVTTNTSSQNDWWGGVDKTGREGIFPANFVHVV